MICPMFCRLGRDRDYPAPRAAIGGFCLCLLLFLATLPALALDRAGARDAYQKAREGEAALRAKPAAERSEAEYKAVTALYDRVPRLDPAFQGCDDSLFNQALLCREAYQATRKNGWINQALRSANWLIREYPYSPLRDEALMLRGDIQAEDLGDPAAARATYETFLKRFRRSRLAPEVERKMAALAGSAGKAPTAREDAASPSAPLRTVSTTSGPAPAGLPATPAPGPAGKGFVAQLSEIRYWSTTDYTRVVVELDREVGMVHDEVENPYRIYIDFQRTILSAAVKGKNFAVGDLFLDRIRVGQYKEDVARVVLDFKKRGSFTIFTLSNPFRVVIDIRDAQNKVTAEERKKKLAKLYQDVQQKAAETKSEDTHPKVKTPEPTGKKAEVAPPKTGPVEPKPTVPEKKPEPPIKVTEIPPKETTPPAKHPEQAEVPSAPAAKKPVPEPAPKPAGPPAGKQAESAPSAPPTPSQPTSDGKRTLARILGMKVAKIVIDPGHGGKDCGSIGWNGIMEKDVTLAIAKRLKTEIEQRLAVEVILTRDRDVFVPLEQRTAIANVEQADLFISLHSNSSKNDRVAGVESFYLGLTREPRAQMLAALENASAQQNLNELEDVIKKITMYEKMNESKDFALKVHRKLFQTLRNLEPSARDRGVKKAPFVVLIGADVPSILLEIGFISNKKEAEIISNDATQGKVAAGISQGVEDYLAGLGTLARNPVHPKEQSADGKIQ
jgi:N-acetylmuramoyl-L-alanine amidase